MDERPYRFAPRPARGALFGLRAGQLAGLVASGGLALGLLQLGGVRGLALALLALAVGAGVLLAPVWGLTVGQWTPILLRFLLGGERRRFRTGRAGAGHVVRIPERGLDPQPAEPAWSFPAELAGLQLVDGELAQYQNAQFGAAVEHGAYTAALRVRGPAFSLAAPELRERMLAEYGAVLAALARDDCPVRRVSWIERTLPGDGDALGDYLLQAKRADATLEEPPEELVSYLQLLDRAGDVAAEHELMFCVQIDTRRPAGRRAVARMGGGTSGALGVLAGELGQLIELLDHAGITVTGVLTRRGLAASIRDTYDPWGARQRHRQVTGGSAGEGIAPHTAGPAARDEHWTYLESDGAFHCALWAAEWPRVDVRALFLQPLLTDSRATRTVAMCMELVGPSRAIRRAERAATETQTEQHLRKRVGQRTSQRQSQRDTAAATRERELAEGHALIRYAAYVTVSVPSSTADPRGALESDVSRVDLEAKRAPLRLERMWGQQAEAFTYTLPLCRGLK